MERFPLSVAYRGLREPFESKEMAALQPLFWEEEKKKGGGSMLASDEVENKGLVWTLLTEKQESLLGPL